MDKHTITCPNCANTLDITDYMEEEIDNNTFWNHQTSWDIGEEANFAVECQGCKEILSVDMIVAWEVSVTF